VSRLFRKGTLRRSEGLVLIEVLMAVVLLALLIVPLVNALQSAAGRADMARGQVARVSEMAKNYEAGAAWEWGAAVSSAWWRPGPTLHMQFEAEEWSDQDLVAGLWVDGWFLGEWGPDGDNSIQVDARALAGCIGDELIVRVRRDGGAWGPPWRLVVPAADGVSLFSDSADGGRSGEIVAHVPALANPALRLSWADTVPEATPPGLPFLLPSVGPSTCDVGLDGRRQSWKTEAGRGLDVYF
jgi:hypothetical protein